MVSIQAELVPNKSGAGVLLGQSVSSILDVAEPDTIEQRTGCRVLKYRAAWLYDTNGGVNQVCVFPGYRGKIAGLIGIGSSVAEVEKALGSVEDYEGVCYGVISMLGWCFEVEQHSPPLGTVGWEAARINCICIYAEDA